VPASQLRQLSTGVLPKDLAALVDLTDFPEVTKDFIENVGDEDAAVVLDHVKSQDDPAAALSELAKAWADPVVMAELIDEDVLAALADGHCEDGEATFEGESLADDPELMAWARQQFGEDFAIEAQVDQEGEEEVEDEGDAEDGNDIAAADWRRLQKLVAEKPMEGKDPNDLPTGQRHQWFETRRFGPGTQLPQASEAGPNPLEAVFGISLDNPRPNRKGPKARMFYPGHEYEPEDMDPFKYQLKMEREKAGDKRRRFLAYKKRSRQDPFAAQKLKMPDFKDVATLTRLVSESGQIQPRRRTGVQAKRQRKLAKMIKCARQFGLLPYLSKLQRPRPGGQKQHEN